ncbi:MAG: hypothetical protein NC191_07095 [Muribaculaceae bacterium]|nr:hypothetical protein [Muribaculaceae bacterium]
MITRIQPYSVNFKSHYQIQLKPYEQKGYLQKQRIPSECDVIESTIESSIPEIEDTSNIYSTIGKIFEDDGLLTQARTFFEKNAQVLLDKRAADSEIRDNDMDLTRIHQKIQTLDIKG